MMTPKRLFAAALLLLAAGLGTVFFKALQNRDAAPQEQELQVEVVVNGSVPAEVVKGWPVIIKTSIYLPPGAAPEIPASGRKAWTELAEIAVTGPGGKKEDWPGEPAPLSVPEGRDLRVSASGPAEAAWVLDPDRSAKLKAGTYTAQVTLRGRKGGVIGASLPVEFRVADSAAPGTDAAKEKMFLEAEAARLRKDAEAEIRAAEDFLRGNPDDADALGLLSQALRRQGRTKEAFEAISRASRLVPGQASLPRHLAKLRHELLVEHIKEEQKKLEAGAAEAR